MRLGDKIDTDGRLYVVSEMKGDEVILIRHDDPQDHFRDKQRIVEDRLEDSWEVVGLDYSVVPSKNIWSEFSVLGDALEEAGFELSSEVREHDPFRNELHGIQGNPSEHLQPPLERCQEIVNRMEAIMETIGERPLSGAVEHE